MPPCHGGGRGFKSRLGRIRLFRSRLTPPSIATALDGQATVRTPPTLVLAAHGTVSAAGHRDLVAIVRNLHRLRPEQAVELGFVDVLLPRVEDVLESLRRPAVLVPALLSTGYHVSADIPRAVRRRNEALISRHLGPDPLLTRALVDALAVARGSAAPGPVALVATGSSDPAAQADVEAAAADLAAALGVPVRATSLADPALHLRGVEVATYLLAEGRMRDSIAARAAEDGATVVSAPIGPHPAVAELILERFDQALRT